jgi:hypothetical protein
MDLRLSWNEQLFFKTFFFLVFLFFIIYYWILVRVFNLLWFIVSNNYKINLILDIRLLSGDLLFSPFIQDVLNFVISHRGFLLFCDC